MNEHDQMQLGIALALKLIWFLCVIVCFLKWKTWTAIFGIISIVIGDIPIGGLYLHRIINQAILYIRGGFQGIVKFSLVSHRTSH